MTPHKDWFDTYQLCNGTFYIGGTNACKIVGVGGVQIQMFDGSVHTISDVRHVLNLIMSILSLENFDDDGYEFSGGKGQLVITKGEIVVARERFRKRCVSSDGRDHG